MQLNFLQENMPECRHSKSPAAGADPQKNKRRIPVSSQHSLLADLPPRPKAAVTKKSETAAAEEKSPAAFRTISEAAQTLGVPAYVLRFWESQFPQISPTKSRGGRRYYRPEDMEILTAIQSLLYKQGYTIKGARKAMSQAKHEAALAVPPAPVRLNAADKPVITPRQRSQLSAVRGELLALREQLMPYLY